MLDVPPAGSVLEAGVRHKTAMGTGAEQNADEMTEAQDCTWHTGFTDSQGEDHMLLPASLAWAAQRLLTWLCRQLRYPWSATSEWQPGHPHAQIVGFSCWAYSQSQQLLENLSGPHTPVAPSFWAVEQRPGWAVLFCRLLQAQSWGWSLTAWPGDTGPVPAL